MPNELAVRPFNARSLVLSVLLGRPRPELTSRALVELGHVFDVAPGTMRTALSRMVAAGELRTDDGTYRLAGRLLDRKAAQDAGRRPAPLTWDGSWWTVMAVSPRRSLAERRAFRTTMVNQRMGELRPDTWLRPANLDGPVGLDDTAVVRGPLTGVDDATLVARLWPLAALAERARRLQAELATALPQLAGDDPGVLPATIGLSATVVRFLRAEPLLPPALAPPDWPVDDLRVAYREFDVRWGRVLTALVS